MWHRRLSMGYSIDTSNYRDDDRYWFHAYTALAALRLGRIDHGGVPMSAGMAEHSMNQADPAQVADQQEIEERFFGGATA